MKNWMDKFWGVMAVFMFIIAVVCLVRGESDTFRWASLWCVIAITNMRIGIAFEILGLHRDNLDNVMDLLSLMVGVKHGK